jgi:hypothetical protein
MGFRVLYINFIFLEVYMLTVLIFIGLGLVLWVVLCILIVEEGTVQLPLRHGQPYRGGVGPGWHFFFPFGPSLRFVKMEREQRFELVFNFPANSATATVTVTARVKLKFFLTAQRLVQTWGACGNELSRQALERVITSSLRPVVERIGSGFICRHLQNNPEEFRRQLQGRLAPSALVPSPGIAPPAALLDYLGVEEPEATEVVFSFPEAVKKEEEKAKKKKEEKKAKEKREEQADEFLEFAKKLGKDLKNPEEFKQVVEVWKIINVEEKKEGKKEEKKK